MQTSKFLAAVCAISFCASSYLFARADDPAQAKAREALRQKMAEVNAQQATPPAAEPAPAPVMSPQPAPAMSSPAVEMPAQETFAPIPPPSPDAVTERAQEALRQKMAELSAQPVVPAPVVAAPAPVAAPVVNSATTPSPAETAAAEAAARQAKASKVNQTKKKEIKHEAAPEFARLLKRRHCQSPLPNRRNWPTCSRNTKPIKSHRNSIKRNAPGSSPNRKKFRFFARRVRMSPAGFVLGALANPPLGSTLASCTISVMSAENCFAKGSPSRRSRANSARRFMSIRSARSRIISGNSIAPWRRCRT